MAMTRDQAQRKAQRLGGKRTYIRFNPKALDAEEKAPLREEMATLRAERDALEKRIKELSGMLLPMRCSILRLKDMGNVGGLGHVQFAEHLADGDTWEECFEKIERHRRNQESLRRAQAPTQQEE